MDMVVTKSITAENSYTDGIKAAADVFEKTDQRNGYLNVSISGTFVATVLLQRSFDDGVTWFTVKEYTAEIQESLNDPERDVLYRLGVATGGFTSGTVAVRLSH